MMRITIIVCTYNRCERLPKALDSIAVQILPEFVEWEVLVVDNNSTDRTREVVEGFRHRFPRQFRYVFEPQQGLSSARNAGIREAKGDVLAFMDDDVTVEPTWLQNLTAALQSPEWAGVGGRILPTEIDQLPNWLALDGRYGMGGVVCAQFDLGETQRELILAPHGTNMAFRKEMFEKYGGFRTDLGRCADSTMSNEDTEFGRRLLGAGERLRYEPSAVVRHPVLKERIRKDYFLVWWYDFGRAMVREWGRGPDVLGIPRPYLNMLAIGVKQIVPSACRWVLALNPKRRFFCKCRVWMAAGEIIEFYRLARRKHSPGASAINLPSGV